MKKRTLVCFLIFTLCVFYTAIPNTVFGQEEGVALAKQVFDEHSETLQRDDVKALLPEILDGLQEAGDVDIPGLIDTAITLINAGAGASLQALAAGQGVTLTDDHIALLADADVQTLLTAETTKQLLGLKGAELQAGLAELLRLANEPTDEEVTPPTDDEEVTPPTDDEEVTPPTDDEEVTPPTDDEEVTPPTDDEVTPPPVTVPMAEPFESVAPTNLSGKSRLGGLSLNNASGRQFVEDFIAALAPAGITLEAEVLVDAILDVVPKGYLPKKQIRQILLSKRLTAFPLEADYLDAENFGNAITPNFADFLYTDFGEAPNQKYLTSDGLHLYTRVPAKVAGVEFSLSNGTLVPGTEVTMDEFQADTIRYTFRLEETLAATNLPAWPSLNTQLFSSVKLRHFDTLRGDYYSVDMQEVSGENGVVWETELGIPPSGSTYYYFEVVLAEPLTFTALDRDAIAALDPTTVTLADIFNPANLHKIRIDGWAMPDPRNLQLADRGILEDLFTLDLAVEFSNILASPQAMDVLARARAGQQVNINEILNVVTSKQLRKIQNILLRNTNALTTQFENEFDPMLASVFTVPRVDLETHSLWTAHIPNIADGNYQLKADVLDADGSVLDRIQENITVDTRAPEADIGISPSDANATGYLNDDGVFVATAPTAGTAAMLNIMGMPKAADVRPGEGYLFYQMIGLNEDGTPFLGDPTERPNTWMPLTVDSTMLVSNIWEAVRGAVAEGRIEAPSDPILQTALALPLSGVLGILNANLQQFAGPFLRGLEPYIGFSSLSDSQAQLIIDALGATIDIVNHLVPVTFDASDHLVMPIQGENVPLLVGDYGIRAMGIDTLFNVGAYATPTHLRIVDPSMSVDSASIMNANIGDFNNDGVVHPVYETGIIYANTEDVMITGAIENPTGHPIKSIEIQYLAPNGQWHALGDAVLTSASDFEFDWKVTGFDSLVDADNVVVLRAVATNMLELTDPEPMAFSINLDAGVYPPEVLALVVDEASMTNPDSDAPQGEVTIKAYTVSQTGPETVKVRFELTQSDGTIVPLGIADQGDTPTDPVDALQAALASAIGGIDASLNPDDYHEWTLTIDTTELADTITKDSGEAARDYTKDNNQHTIRAFAVSGDATEWPSDKTAMLSVDNVDDVAPLAPTSVSVTSVDGVDTDLKVADDGSYTVGGLVDKYDDASPVATFTIEPVAKRKTYKSVKFTTDAEGVLIGEITETAEGSGVFTVTVDVGTLADGETYLENGSYTFQALAYDEFDNVEADTDGSKASVTVENTYRPAPEVLAIAVDPESITQTNPDSGAPQGIITINAYSHEISSPATAAVRLEAKRPGDAEWIDVGTATQSMATTEVSDATLTDFLSDLVNTAVSATEAAEDAEGVVVPISQTYQMWMIEVDTTMIMPEADDKGDTITADSPAARDASKDDNQYMVRAVPIEEADDFANPEASPNATAMFSVDNVDDVAPLGPTNIIAVSDILADGTEANIEANEDDSYSVGGVVDLTVRHPVAIFTIKPTADRTTYASVKLVTDAEGIIIEEAVEVEDGVFKITTDVAEVPNGTYMFHALAVDDADPVNVQDDMSETDGSGIAVGVRNIRVSDISDLAVIAVDGTDVADAPTEPIPLRDSVTVSFMVENGSLEAEELSGKVNESVAPSESAEDPENTFSLMVALKSLNGEPVTDGVYTPDGLITRRNGSVPFPLAQVNVDNTGPMIIIESPTEDETVNSLPTIRATYHDGAGAGVDGATGSLTLVRLQPPNEVEVVVDQADLEKDAGSLVYTRSEPLAGGAYRVTVQVTDNLGTVGEGSAEFAVNGTAPTVAIHSPATGQTFEHGEPLISGEFSGAGTVEVTTFTINDVDATPEVDGNQFSYTPDEALANGDYKIVVAVTDGDGNMAQTSVGFMVDIPEPPKDTTPPVISEVAPSGTLVLATNGDVITLSAVVFDEQSDVVTVRFRVNDLPFQSVSTPHIKAGEIQIDYLLEPGTHTAEVVAVSEGGTTKHGWTFSLVFDDVKPTITSITPSGTIRGGLPVISASASDDSGVDEMSITLMDSNGEEVEGNTEDDSDEGVEGITRLDFNPEAPLEEGTYTIEVRATDTIGNSATAKGTFTIDFDTAAPIITMATPQNEARLTNRRPQISITYADAESGIDVDSIRFVFDDKLINLTPNQKSASQVIYTPPADLAFGQHTVKLEVSDMAHKEGNVSEKNKDARKSNMAVHEFTFFVESTEGPILAWGPINVPNPFNASEKETRISFRLTRRSTVSIIIYDMTLRPVRVLLDNAIWDAGEYIGKNAIGWDGTSSNGEDLARGVYFCQIIVTDSIEPEYAILKIALTR